MNYVCHLGECGVVASLKGVRLHKIVTIFISIGILSRPCPHEDTASWVLNLNTVKSRLLKWVLLQKSDGKVILFCKGTEHT